MENITQDQIAEMSDLELINLQSSLILYIDTEKEQIANKLNRMIMDERAWRWRI